MRKYLPLCLRVAALAGSLLVSPLARAEGVSPADATPAQVKTATVHFKTGKRHLEQKLWENAVSDLRASLDVVDSPNARLELARALVGAGKLAEAWTEYDRTAAGAAKLAGAEPKYRPTVDAAATERDALEARLAFVVVNVDHAPPETMLSIGGKQVPKDRDKVDTKAIVEPGRVEVIVQSGGKDLARATVNASVGTKTPVTLDAAPPPPPAPVALSPATPPVPGVEDDKMSSAPPTETLPPEPPPAPSKLRVAVWPAAGLAVAGFATFGIAGAVSTSTYNDLQNKCHGPCPPGNEGEISSGRTQQTIANVGLVVGIVGAVGAGVLFFVSRPHAAAAAAPSAAVMVGPGWLGVGGTL